jgi:hypothetical protein
VKNLKLVVAARFGEKYCLRKEEFTQTLVLCKSKYFSIEKNKEFLSLVL